MHEITLNILGNVAVAHLDSPDEERIKKRVMWVLQKEVPDYSLVIFKNRGVPKVISLLDQDDHSRTWADLSCQ